MTPDEIKNNEAQKALEKIRHSTKIFLNATDINAIVGADACDIRWQAHDNPSKLGYPVSVCGRRVKIPRLAFLRWVEYGLAAPKDVEPIAEGG